MALLTVAKKRRCAGIVCIVVMMLLFSYDTLPATLPVAPATTGPETAAPPTVAPATTGPETAAPPTVAPATTGPETAAPPTVSPADEADAEIASFREMLALRHVFKDTYEPIDDQIVKEWVAAGALRLMKPDAVPTMEGIRQGLVQPVIDRSPYAITPVEVDVVKGSRCRAGGSGPPVAMCVLVRNRVKQLTEFLQWHRIMGVDEFYIYDDGSRDGLLEALQPFVDAGVVVGVWTMQARQKPFVFRYDGYKEKRLGTQIPTYGRCLQESRARHPDGQWVGFVDVDEFWLPALREDGSGVCIPEVLRWLEARDPEVGVAAVQWDVTECPARPFDDLPSQFDNCGLCSERTCPWTKAFVWTPSLHKFHNVHLAVAKAPRGKTLLLSGQPYDMDARTCPETDARPDTPTLLHVWAQDLRNLAGRLFDGKVERGIGEAQAPLSLREMHELYQRRGELHGAEPLRSFRQQVTPYLPLLYASLGDPDGARRQCHLNFCNARAAHRDQICGGGACVGPAQAAACARKYAEDAGAGAVAGVHCDILIPHTPPVQPASSEVAATPDPPADANSTSIRSEINVQPSTVPGEDMGA
eukprot:TRINITY_DN4146_c0_g1_i2.p1 TRINITY_DN4146_c0_g1~~TRINITY_DN4146_c0_g1_i2.p1  ORF type:complete len:585 (+),score=118.31 TRINITY_DN4146_c0_g1_i2:60-1814(+)